MAVLLDAPASRSPHAPSVFGDTRNTLLTAEDERELARAVRCGDAAARARFAAANLGLVATIARFYVAKGTTFEDLMGEGQVGLLTAIDRFDPERGVRFSTYAAHWIRTAIRESLNNNSRLVRLPAHAVTLMRKWKRQEAEMAREDGVIPSFDRVADRLGLSESQREIAKKARKQASCEADGPGIMEQADERGEAPGEAMERSDSMRGIRSRMASRLDERERAVIELRFGLGGGEPMTLREVGEQLGISREWVSRIEERAVAKLRD